MAANANRGSRLARWIPAALIVSLTVVTHLPLLLHHQPIDDERVYAGVANEIVDGGQPYVSAVERKPPLLFWTYAAVFKSFGKYNWDALHAVSTLWVLLTMAGLHVTGRRLFNRETGLVAALLYGIFQPGIYWNNQAFNGEVLMNLPVVWAYAIAFAPSRSRIRPELLVSGALLAAGFLLKQPAALAAIPVGLYLLMHKYRAARGHSVFDSLRQVGLLTAGFASIIGLAAAVLWREGLLREAVYWTIGDHDVPYMFWGSAVERTAVFGATCLPLIIGSALAATEASGWSQRRPERQALLLLTLASAVGIAMAGRFYPHYYIALIPSLSLLAAPLFAGLWTSTSSSTNPGLAKFSQGWIAVSVVVFGAAAWIGFGRQPAGTETGRYLRLHSSPNERIFVWGHAAGIYLEAQRRPASRYILTFPLTGRIFGSERPPLDTTSRILPGSWDTLAQDLRAHPAAFIADLEVGPGAEYPAERFAMLKRMLETEYQPVARTAEALIYRRRP